MKEHESLLAGYYRLAQENRNLDSEGRYLDGVIVLHQELERLGINHRWPT